MDEPGPSSWNIVPENLQSRSNSESANVDYVQNKVPLVCIEIPLANGSECSSGDECDELFSEEEKNIVAVDYDSDDDFIEDGEYV